MSFSLFTFIFIVLVLILFYGIRNKARAYLLLLVGFVWIAVLDLRSCIALLICTAVVYEMALISAYLVLKDRKKQAIRSGNISIVILVFCLVFLKWFPILFGKLPVEERLQESVSRNLLLPLGFSYYVFQAIAYIKDVSRGKIQAEKNPARLALYLSFFPKFISGPIERAEDLLPQFKKLESIRLLENRRLSVSFSYLLYGFFLKTVVADRLAIYTRRLFLEYPQHSSLWLLLGSLMYTIQIYCDFAGYSSIAVGAAKLFGVELTQNFQTPYLAHNISDFWRRWHKSLSSWLRDYIYIPLGGNRKGRFRQCCYTLIVFLVCGLWHGSGFQFLAWGVLHAFYSVMDILLRRKRESSGVSLWIGRIVTFAAVSFAWIFFGSETLGKAFGYIRSMFSAGAAGLRFAEESAGLGIEWIDVIILLVSLLIVILTDIASYRKNKPFPEVIQDWKYGYRYLVYYFAILTLFVFGIYGPGYDAGSFMYMDF